MPKIDKKPQPKADHQKGEKIKAQTLNEKKIIRQPIVAVMGHVDHGKTTFLDSIKGTKIADKEHGGITQNTRVHEITTKSGFKITFIDTPGHEAFSKMRERGARVTDFVVLVVAADDGVQPQTKESIEFAQKHNVPIIVCINKIDIEGVKTQKIKTELSSFGVQIEELGGESLCFEISAKNKIGLDEVLEGIELLAEIHSLEPHQPKEGVEAEAFVLESFKDKNLGHIATCILKSGALNDRLIGFTLDSGFKARAYFNEEQKPIKEVHESQPFVVSGLEKDISTGEIINFATDSKKVKEVQEKLRTGELSEDAGENLDTESLFAQMLMQRAEKKEGVEQKALNVIVRASTQGTLEALIAQLNELETEESKVKILSSGTGTVSEEDIMRAKVAKAIILTFQSPSTQKILAAAKKERVILRDYEIIYKLVDEIAEVLDSMDQPQEEEVEIARARIKQVFTLTDKSVVAGSEITKGIFTKGYRVWIERKGAEIARAKIKMIKQNKLEVKEVKKGMDCGLLLDPNVENLQEGDEVVAYKVERL